MLDWIKKILSSFNRTKKPYKEFVSIYSLDREERRKQVWANLQEGILFEDKQIMIPWQTPFNQLDKYKESYTVSRGKNTWYFGERKILNGYGCHVEVNVMSHYPMSNPMTTIYENLGSGYVGMKNFNFLKEYITDLLGPPVKIELEKWGDFDLGEIRWVNNKVHITLVGVEVFETKYYLYIGLLYDANEQYGKDQIAKMRASGITEEELGK